MAGHTYMYGGPRKIEISLSFLGLVDTPHNVANVMGALSPKQRDFRRSTSRRPPKGPPKGPKPQAPYGGKTASPKKEGEIQFCVVLRSVHVIVARAHLNKSKRSTLPIELAPNIVRNRVTNDEDFV